MATREHISETAPGTPAPVVDKGRPIQQAFNPWRLSVLLTAAASAIWSVSLVQMSRSGLAVDDLGLLNAYPVTYWVAIGILTVAAALLWRDSRDHKALLLLQIFLFLCILWFTPLINGHALFGTRDAFSMHSLTQNLLETSHLDPETQWYHNWPTGNLLEAALIQLCGLQYVNPLLIYGVIPVQLLIVLSLYVLFRYTLGQNNLWIAAAWIFLLFNWTGAAIYSPQGMALVMFLLTISLYFRLITKQEGTPLRFVVIILLFGLTATHLLTSLGLLFITIAFIFVKRREFFMLSVIYTGMLGAWLIYYSTGYFLGHFSRLLDRILDIGVLFHENLMVNKIGSDNHLFVVATRMYYTAAAGLVGAGGLLLSWWRRNHHDRAFLLMIIALVVMLPVQFYTREFFSRIFLYILPALAYFGTKLAATRLTSIILVVVLLAALPFSVITLHGSQRWNTLAPEQLHYWQFLEENTYQGFEPYYQTSLLWLLDQPEATDASAELNDNPDWHKSVMVWVWIDDEPPELVSTTPSERAMFWVFADAPHAVDETLEWLKTSELYDYVYTAGGVDAFSPKYVK